MKLRERNKTVEQIVPNRVQTRLRKGGVSVTVDDTKKVASTRKRTRSIKSSPPDQMPIAKKSTQTVANTRVTRSRIPKAGSHPLKSLDKANNHLKLTKSTLLTPKSSITAKSKDAITNYFKIDDTPKDERMNRSLLIKSTPKKVCWANVLRTSQTLSNVSDDPYEFIDELPVTKRAKKKTPKSTSTTRKVGKKMKKKTNSKEQPVKNVQSNNTPSIGSSSSSTKDSSTPRLEISSINGTLDLGKVNQDKHDASKSPTIDIHSDVTPSKSDMCHFKTPAPLFNKKDNHIFFTNVMAVSTPKLSNIREAKLSKNFIREDKNTNATAQVKQTETCESLNISVVESSPTPESDPVGTEEINNSNFDKIDDIAIATEDQPLAIATKELSRIEPEEIDELEMDLENDCVLSGSFLETQNSIYDEEELERSSTPNNTEMFDLSLARTNTSNLNETANAKSLDQGDANPFSLYGSPIELSPIKKCSTVAETEKPPTCTKRSSQRKILACSNKSGETKSTSNEKKAKPKKKKEEPKDPDYEKWLQNITADLEDAENIELIVE